MRQDPRDIRPSGSAVAIQIGDMPAVGSDSRTEHSVSLSPEQLLPSCLDSPHSDAGECEWPSGSSEKQVAFLLGSPALQPPSLQPGPACSNPPLDPAGINYQVLPAGPDLRVDCLDSYSPDQRDDSVSPTLEVDSVIPDLLLSLASPEPPVISTEPPPPGSHSPVPQVQSVDSSAQLESRLDSVGQELKPGSPEQQAVSVSPAALDDARVESSTSAGPITRGRRPSDQQRPKSSTPGKFFCPACGLNFKQEKDLQRHDCFLLASDVESGQGQARRHSQEASGEERGEMNMERTAFRCPFKKCTRYKVRYVFMCCFFCRLYILGGGVM